MPLSAGKRLGPYEIVAPIGAGGMGEVYRARDTRLNRDVAIKVLPDHMARDPQALARFQREAMAVGALAHPNIMVLHDIGAEQEVHYAVMELLEGDSLHQRLARGPMPWRKVAELGSAMAEGLAAAHSKGIVHQDIKPGNIFLTSDGRVKVLDFGLAQMRTAPEATEATATLTEIAPAIMGTIGYMSPEQVRGEKAMPTSDIFALGCVLYEMVTGRRAFEGKSATEIMASVLKDEPPSVADSGQLSSQELIQVIERCLEKDPAQRFQSARDLAFALRTLASSAGEYKPAAAPPPAVRSKRRFAVVAGVAVLLIAAGAALYFSRGRHADMNIDSLAVLPFASGSGADTEWLSDGITDGLIGSLVQIPGIKVMSRNAVMRYKGKDIDAREAANKLGVRAVLSGRISEHENHLSVSAELIDARDGTEIWGDNYSRTMSDILAVQQDIIHQISGILRAKLDPQAIHKMMSPGTDNPEAYQLYLKGKHFAGDFTKAGFDKGMDYFRQAIAVDPNYARAYEGIAYAYCVAEDAMIPPLDAMPRAKEAATKAIALDDSLSTAHGDLASILLWFDYDWPGATREFQRALQLNPNDYLAHEFYSWLLAIQGDFDNGIAEGQRSLEADPLSVEAEVILGLDYYLARRFPEALDTFRKSIDLNPDYPPDYWGMGLVYMAQNQPKDAAATLEKGLKIAPLDWSSEVLAAAYATQGDRAKAQKILDDYAARAKSGGYVPQYFLSYAYLALGDRNRALTALEKDYENRTEYMTFLKTDPYLDSLRNEPRFQALLKKMKFQ